MRARVEHDRVAPGVSRFGISRSFDGAPHTVTIEPDELRPFALRFHFHEMQDEAGAVELWQVKRELVAPAVGDSEEEPINWTPRHERTLATNAFAYRRHAEDLFSGKFEHAGEVRRGMLALVDEDNARKRADELDDLYLMALEREVQARRETGDDLLAIALDLGMSRTKLYRRRREAKRRNL